MAYKPTGRKPGRPRKPTPQLEWALGIAKVDGKYAVFRAAVDLNNGEVELLHEGWDRPRAVSLYRMETNRLAGQNKRPPQPPPREDADGAR